MLVDTGVRARIFARSGEILADSFVLGGPGGQVQIRSLPPEPEGGLGLLRRLLNLVGKWLPGEDNFPLYREAPEQRASDYGEVTGALAGHSPGMVRLDRQRSEEHTSELQSLMRISYAVFCLKQKNKNMNTTHWQLNQTLISLYISITRIHASL